MMQGISTLPGAQQVPQNPGQAAPVQALPAQQPMTPQTVTGRLEGLPPQQLLQMFANPADQTPKWAVVSAYAKAIEQQRLMEAARGQQAMQQGQMQAQQLPVAAEVMSQPVGIAQFAGGGAVAFEKGGAVQKFANGLSVTQDDYALDESPEFPGSYGQPGVPSPKLLEEERQRKISELQQSIEFLEGLGSEATKAQAAAKRAELENLMTPSAPRPVSTSYPETFGRRFPSPIVRQVAQPTGQPARPSGTPRQPAVPAAAAEPGVGIAGLPADLTPEQRSAIAQRRAAIEARRNLPEDVVSGRAGLEALARANLAAQETEAQAFAREARETLEAAQAKRAASPASDMAFLGAMLEGGRGGKRAGNVISGFAVGAGKATAARDAALREAEKDFRAAQRDERLMQGNLRQARMLEAQRAQALRENDMTRVQQIDEQLAALSMEQEALRRSMAKESADFGLRQRQASAEERKARAAEISAAKPTEFEIWRRDPEGYAKFLEAKTGGKQDVSELRALISALRDQADPMKNFDAISRQQAATMLKQAQDKLAQMSGLQTSGSAPTAGAARPTSQADFEALPKGARFINPADGKEYVKN